MTRARSSAARAALTLIAACLTAAAVPVPTGAASRAPEPATPHAPTAHADPVDAPQSPLDLVSVTFGQQGANLVLDLRTAAPLDTTRLDSGAGRSVCVLLMKGRLTTPRARICALNRLGAPTLRYTRLDPAGAPVGLHPLKATVTQPDPQTLHAVFAPAAAGLRVPSRFRWRAVSRWTDDAAGCPQAAGGCADYVPSGGEVPARLVRPVPAFTPPTGCVARAPWQVRRSPHRTNAVALTFDDGPSPYTPGFLKVLEREHVPGTFFMIGQQVAGHGDLLKRMLRDGDMIGNHSWSHPDLSGGGAFASGQVSSTQKAIRKASGGFTPCLMRPPYGATSSGLVSTLRSMGLDSILWDVDPQDWRTPGTGAIEGTILHEARAGSIVLMHDGGGPRGQTLAALPHVIAAFRARHYRFVTVADLLGLKVLHAKTRTPGS